MITAVKGNIPVLEKARYLALFRLRECYLKLWWLFCDILLFWDFYLINYINHKLSIIEACYFENHKSIIIIFIGLRLWICNIFLLQDRIPLKVIYVFFLARISTPKNIVGKTAECDRFKIDSAGAGGPRGDSLGHSFFFTQQGRLLMHPRALGIGRAARKSIHHCIK